MSDALRARDPVEAHVLRAVEALAQVLGTNAQTYPRAAERSAHRREALAAAARAVAAAQAANAAAPEETPDAAF